MARCWHRHPIDPEKGKCKSGHPYRTPENKPKPRPKKPAHPAAEPVNLTGKADVGKDGGEFIDVQTTEPVADWANVFARFNLDPDVFEIVGDTVRCSTWQTSKRTETGDRDVVNLYSYRASFRRRREGIETPAELVQRIEAFIPNEHPQKLNSGRSLVVVPTDLQLGKTDWNGGTPDTLEQVLASFHKAAGIARETRPAEIVMVDAGDVVENIYNTSSQLATNDTDLPHQVERAMHIMLTGIQLLAPLAPSFKYVAVSSNHGAHRIGQKAPAGDVHADYGIVIAKMLGRALELNREAFGHVQVITPHPYMESLAFETSGSRIGVVHGHQASSADKLGEWWKGQSHGNMPTADARILIAGHWHSMRVQQSGDARWILVGPASDRGSSWFTNARGESSQSGMLSFLTSGNAWSELRIL